MSELRHPAHGRQHRGVDGLVVGARVQVRNRFLSEFVGGFEVLEVTADGCVVRRCSDGARLPAAFGADEVRPDTTGADLLLR